MFDVVNHSFVKPSTAIDTCVCEDDSAKVGEGDQTVSLREILDDPFSISLAEIPNLVSKRMRDRLPCGFIFKGYAATVLARHCCRHRDGIATRDLEIGKLV